MRIISYNVLEGMQKPAGRRKAVADWLASQKPGVVAFLELNGYTEARLREEAQAWGHEHAVLLKEKGYPTGLTSRSPITDVQRVLGGFHHGAMRLKTGGVTYYVVHLSPFDSRVRMMEAAQILAGVKDGGIGHALDGAQAALVAKQPVVVLGDFNSLSPDDREYHKTSAVKEHTAATDATDPRRHNLGDDGELHFQVIQRFKDAGLEDVIRSKHGDAGALLSYPTPLVHAERSRQDLRKVQVRIDYILASQELAKTCTRAEVMSSEAFDTMSDHYPLIADFDWAPETNEAKT